MLVAFSDDDVDCGDAEPEVPNSAESEPDVPEGAGPEMPNCDMFTHMAVIRLDSNDLLVYFSASANKQHEWIASSVAVWLQQTQSPKAAVERFKNALNSSVMDYFHDLWPGVGWERRLSRFDSRTRTAPQDTASGLKFFGGGLGPVLMEDVFFTIFLHLSNPSLEGSNASLC